MESDPDRNVGRTDLSGELGSIPAPRETDPTPAVTRPGVGPGSTMVTRSRARGGRGMNGEQEMEFRPEVEFRQEMDILYYLKKVGVDIISCYDLNSSNSQRYNAVRLCVPQCHIKFVMNPDM